MWVLKRVHPRPFHYLNLHKLRTWFKPFGIFEKTNLGHGRNELILRITTILGRKKDVFPVLCLDLRYSFLKHDNRCKKEEIPLWAWNFQGARLNFWSTQIFYRIVKVQVFNIGRLYIFKIKKKYFNIRYLRVKINLYVTEIK